jgi:DNA-binding transcriptional MerR regulator
MVGRVGWYGPGHVARLKYVGQLQERGFSLAAIHDLLRGWEEGRSLTEVLGFEEALTAPWSDEVPERISLARLAELFPEGLQDPGLLQRAVDIGLLRFHDGEVEAPSPELLRVGAELVAAGIPLAAALDEYASLAADIAPIARRFVKLFEDHIWAPFVAAGLPADRLGDVSRSLRRIRPTAAAAVVAVLAQAMEQAVAASAAEQVGRLMPPAPGSGAS